MYFQLQYYLQIKRSTTTLVRHRTLTRQAPTRIVAYAFVMPGNVPPRPLRLEWDPRANLQLPLVLRMQ